MARAWLADGAEAGGDLPRGGERQFWNVNGFENAVVIELANERFSRLIVSVDDPAECVHRISSRARAE